MNLIDRTKVLKMRLLNTLGQVVIEENFQNIPSGNHLFELESSSLSKGVYFLEIFVDGVNVKGEKVIKLNGF